MTSFIVSPRAYSGSDGPIIAFLAAGKSVDYLLRDLFDIGGQLLNRARRETLIHHAAEGAVLGRIHVQQLAQDDFIRQRRARFLSCDEQDLVTAKQLRLARYRHYIFMFRDCPERDATLAFVPEDRGLASEQRPFLMRIAALHIQVGIDDVDRVET